MTPAEAAAFAAPLPTAIDAATRTRLVSALAASKAPATRRAYRTAWAAWTAWADAHGATALPAAPEAVAAYLAHRAADAGMATLRMAAAAVAAAHDLAGHANPCADRIVKTAMQGFARQAAEAGATARQARGLDAEAVAAIRGALDGKINTPAGALTMAIVSAVADAGLRRSEAAALEWRDIEPDADGSGRVAIRRSKTDQEAEGAVVAITPAAMADLDRLATLRGGGRGTEGRVFGLSDRQIARRIAAAAKAAGLGDGFSGHSGRVGMAQRMTRNGAPAAAVMRQGRWESTRMVARYTRSEAAGEALRYL